MGGYLIPPPPDAKLRAEWEAGVAAREAAESAGVPFLPAERRVRQDRPVIVYMDMNEIGALFGVSGRTVSSWRRRYATTNPTPAPDAMTGPTPGWLPSRRDEWRAWHASRTGQGRGGGRPPKRQPE